MNTEQNTGSAANAPSSCPGCRKGDKTIEASRMRFEHFMSVARARGERRLKEHIIEQVGEETFNFSYNGLFHHIQRKLMVEGWREEEKRELDPEIEKKLKQALQTSGKGKSKKKAQ